ncbi:hypothetical protein AB6A40_005100 [Gnathostoma spinigerum]|uniref:TM2 domain-containing protein n=1 Tax=Gnathostoma spinigerum TaxID=75299 RepID=A0ABD6EGQ9_9BILA
MAPEAAKIITGYSDLVDRFWKKSVSTQSWKRMQLLVVFAYTLSNLVQILSDNAEVKVANSPMDDISFCSRVHCPLYGSCLNCRFPDSCTYGSTVIVDCDTSLPCARKFSIRREAKCQYCWQSDPNDYDCDPVYNCTTTSTRRYRTSCRVHQRVICKGRRSFFKNVRCNWSSGYSWSKAMILSVTLGGFGVDRFYLGLWKSAIGKLFSFGGLGAWTVVDVVLIATGYIGPADGSLYM